MLTEEKIEKNYSLFKRALEQSGVNPDKFSYEKVETVLKNASFSMRNGENGNVAYEGSLIDVVLRILTPYATKINEMLPANMQVDKNSIVKVCLLSHIAKSVMFIKNDNQWEIEKMGKIYKFAPTNVALKLGIKSLLIAQSLGVTFTEEEAEAMTVIDRSETDEQTKYFSSKLATIIKNANDLTQLTLREQKNEN